MKLELSVKLEFGDEFSDEFGDEFGDVLEFDHEFGAELEWIRDDKVVEALKFLDEDWRVGFEVAFAWCACFAV